MLRFLSKISFLALCLMLVKRFFFVHHQTRFPSFDVHFFSVLFRTFFFVHSLDYIGHVALKWNFFLVSCLMCHFNKQQAKKRRNCGHWHVMLMMIYYLIISPWVLVVWFWCMLTTNWFFFCPAFLITATWTKGLKSLFFGFKSEIY